MGQEISGIKIGMTMNELKDFVNNQTNLSSTQKASIFNYIEDEGKIGDGIITNEIELTMLESWLKPNNNNAKVDMPEQLDATDEDVSIIPDNDKRHKRGGITKTTLEKRTDNNITENTITTSNRFNSERYAQITEDSGTKISDVVYTNVKDGPAKMRSYIIEKSDGSKTIYQDENLDGKFDTKSVIKNGSKLKYNRQEDGSWGL